MNARLKHQRGTERPISAVERARMAWATMANETRCDLRTIGIRGELRALDEMASGTRGRSAPTQLTKLALEMRDGRIPHEVARARLAKVGADIADLVYGNDAA